MTSRTTTYLSKKGLKELRKSIAKLEHRQQKAIADLHDFDKIDNHDQRLARIEKLAQLEIIESELADKHMISRTAKQLPRKRDAFKVAMGSVVDLIDTNGRMMSYMLVDSIEANPSDGRISVNSPLGQTLLGKTIQESVQWGTSLRRNKLTLVRIQ